MGWISVKDVLPEMDNRYVHLSKDVDIRLADGTEMTGFYSTARKCWYSCKTYRIVIGEVTHWKERKKMSKYIVEIPDNDALDINENQGAFVYRVGDNFAMSGKVDALIPYKEPDSSAEVAWELAQKISNMAFKERKEAFGNGLTMIDQLFYSEARQKYDAWKKKKEEIHVGDEVIAEVIVVDADDGQLRDPVVLTNVYDNHWEGVDDRGVIHSINGIFFKIKKTGRHFDQVEELLKAMKEGQ